MSKETKVKRNNYFDSPDGNDLLDKLWYVLKPTALSGLFISTADVMLYSRPVGYMATLGRYAYITIPLLGMSTAFVLTTNTLANIREKDDKINWALGACAAGMVFGKWRNSTVAGSFACVAFSAAAVLKKHAIQNNWELIPRNKPLAHGGLWAVKHDYSLVRDYKEVTGRQ